MKPKSLIYPLLLLCLCATAISTLGQETTGADRITIPVGSQGGDHANIVVPQKGLKQAQVREQFGEPLQQTAPKGSPPISRWRYDTFVVYFEGDTVIHSVIIHHPQTDAGTQQDITP